MPPYFNGRRAVLYTVLAGRHWHSVGSSPTGGTNLGAFWFRLNGRCKIARRGRLAGLLKSKSKNINAEDTDVDALLAQAEYIFNNADEFVTADVEEALFA